MAAALVAMRTDAALTDVHVVCKDGAKAQILKSMF